MSAETNSSPSTVVAVVDPAFSDAERSALAAFLAGYPHRRTVPPAPPRQERSLGLGSHRPRGPGRRRQPRGVQAGGDDSGPDEATEMIALWHKARRSLLKSRLHTC